MSAKRAIFVAPFDELFEPALLAELAVRAELRGWHGFFLWDHVRYSPPASAVADPWIALSAIAVATESLRIGPLVTPLSRRRVQKVARETVTLDHLSRGRLVLGVGLGGERHGELGPFGEVEDPKERARLLDQGLERLTALWDGEFQPPPLQQPRIPVWVGARWPNRRPVRRAASWDGLFPIDLTEPAELAQLVAEVKELRRNAPGPFEILVTIDPDTDPAPWEAAGATWCLTDFGPQPKEAEVRAVIESL